MLHVGAAGVVLYRYKSLKHLESQSDAYLGAVTQNGRPWQSLTTQEYACHCRQLCFLLIWIAETCRFDAGFIPISEE